MIILQLKLDTRLLSECVHLGPGSGRKTSQGTEAKPATSRLESGRDVSEEKKRIARYFQLDVFEIILQKINTAAVQRTLV